MSDKDLNILLIDEDPARAALLEGALVEAGYTFVVTLQKTTNLQRRIVAIQPDMVIIDLQNPDRDTLENMFEVTRSVKKPIAMFVDRSDRETTRRAVEAGVSAYVVDGLKKDRVLGVIDLAISRFENFTKVVEERDAARTALADRKRVDRAKGLLIYHKGLTEEEAYTMMRKAAMHQGRKMIEIAESIITALELDLDLSAGGRKHG